MKKRYEWRELTDHGLLVSPPAVGPYYDRSGVNKYGGFDSEDEAVQAYGQFVKDNKYGVPSELVLVTFYIPE